MTNVPGYQMSDERKKILAEALRVLSEHFENVQIFVSVSEEGVTGHSNIGNGNQFAILGQVDTWVSASRFYHRNCMLETMLKLGQRSDDEPN